MVNYKIVYREKGASSGTLPKIDAQFKDVRRLAQFLNAFIKNNPNFFVLYVYIANKDGLFSSKVHFLQDEYAAQKWLTGWKERVLANALERGFDIKWNHGLKKIESNNIL